MEVSEFSSFCVLKLIDPDETDLLVSGFELHTDFTDSTDLISDDGDVYNEWICIIF